MAGTRGERARSRWVGLAVGGVPAAGGLILLWIIAPNLYATGADGRMQAIAVTRTGVLGVAAGLVALAGVLLNLIETRKANELTRHANELTRQRDALTHERELAEQRTERYTAAIGQLGSPTTDIRLGGIYALERLARDSPDDQPTIVEVLSAFVRARGHDQVLPVKPSLRTAERHEPAAPDAPPAGPAIDVQAAVTVLGRLPVLDSLRRADLTGARLSGPVALTRIEAPGGNLAGVDLTGADLADAHLPAATLTEARLDGADLTSARLHTSNCTGASFRGADLSRADLEEATLTGARLSGAILARAELGEAILVETDLSGADLSDADLDCADLSCADLSGANLSGAYLSSTNLSSARGLTVEMLERARADAWTRVPEGLRPATWPPEDHANPPPRRILGGV